MAMGRGQLVAVIRINSTCAREKVPIYSSSVCTNASASHRPGVFCLLKEVTSDAECG